MKQITILDFSTATVYIRILPEELENAQAEDVLYHFCEELDIRADDCQYMVGDLTIDNEE